MSWGWGGGALVSRRDEDAEDYSVSLPGAKLVKML